MNQRLSRSELYELVWSKPMYKLACEVGLSDKGLAKKCAKHIIPRPPLGYWTRLESDKIPNRQALPQNDNPDLDIIEFDDRRDLPKLNVKDPRASILDGMEIEKISRRRLPIVADSKALFRRGVSDEYGFIRVRQDVQSLDIRVTQGSLSRAHKIFVVLDEMSKQCGFVGLHYAKHSYGDTQYSAISFDGESAHISISEETKRRESKSKYGAWMERTYIPTGRLTLNIHNPAYGRRTAWRDGKKTIEQRLPEILTGMANAAKAILENRNQQERWHKQWEENQRVQRMEIARRDGLNTLLDEYSDYTSKKAILNKVTQDLSAQQRQENMEWLDWAEQFIEQLNPVRKFDELAGKWRF